MHDRLARSLALSAIGSAVGCCAPPPVGPLAAPTASALPPVVPQPVVPPASTFVPIGAGPTVLARVANGYELRNRAVRIVIDDHTGDVVFWGPVPRPRNVLAGPRGLHVGLAGLPDVPPAGYVEKRDDQTWQFYGSDANGVTWRKVYNLDHASLLVSFVIQNNRPAPLPATIQLRGDLPGLHVTTHDPEQFTATDGDVTVSLHGWNKAHGQPPPPLPVLLQSDTFTLKPAEREGYTTEWRLSPLGGP